MSFHFAFVNRWLADFAEAEKAAYLAGFRDGAIIAAVVLVILFLLFLPRDGGGKPA